MYNNVGGKIKTFAKVVFTLGLVFTIISAFYLLSSGAGSVAILLLLLLAVGALFTWVISLFIYGFGELLVNVKVIARNLKDKENDTDKYAENNMTIKQVIANDFINNEETIKLKCPHCDCVNKFEKDVLKHSSILKCSNCDNIIAKKEED